MGPPGKSLPFPTLISSWQHQFLLSISISNSHYQFNPQHQFPCPNINFSFSSSISSSHHQFPLPDISIPLSNISFSFFLPDRDSVLCRSTFLSLTHALQGARSCPQPQGIYSWSQGTCSTFMYRVTSPLSQ